MKKIGKILLLICLFFTVVLKSVCALPSHTEALYVNDFANVLSDETKSYILSNSRVLDEKTTAQVVVTTVESLEGKEIDEYALDLGRTWGIGKGDKDNGLIILLAPNERKVKIEVGDGLEGAINDAKAGKLIDNYAVSEFKNDNWDAGIKNLYTSILVEVYKEYNMEIPEDIPSEFTSGVDEDEFSDFIVPIVGGLVILILFIIYKKNNGKGPPFTGYYDNDSTFFGGGNFGGGGSFSGGGGSFGGGSFSGGGASRSF